MATVQDTYTSVGEFLANVPKFKLSDLNLHIIILPEGMAEGKEIHVLAKRPTVDVLDGMQRMLKETGQIVSDRIRDIVELQLLPLLLAWNVTDDAGEIIPFEVDRIIKDVPADVINVLITTISNAMTKPAGVPDPNEPVTSSPNGS